VKADNVEGATSSSLISSVNCLVSSATVGPQEDSEDSLDDVVLVDSKPLPKELVETMDQEGLRSVLKQLLRHPDTAVRGAAGARVSKPSSSCKEEHWIDNMLEPARSSADDPGRAPSAMAVSSAELVLGIEADEDSSARGDVTQAFAQDAEVLATGARQVFCIGSIKLPVGNVAVPASATAIVINNGQVPWPEAASVVSLAGESFGFSQMPLGAVNPGEDAEIVLDLLVSPRSEPCTERSTWGIINAATGESLGLILSFTTSWCRQ
jgi:hypothetical protein